MCKNVFVKMCFVSVLLVFIGFCWFLCFFVLSILSRRNHFWGLLGRAFSFPFIYLYHIHTPSIRQPPEQNLLRPQVSVY